MSYQFPSINVCMPVTNLYLELHSAPNNINENMLCCLLCTGDINKVSAIQIIYSQIMSAVQKKIPRVQIIHKM